MERVTIREIADELAVARRLRAECDSIGQQFLIACDNGDERQTSALARKRALFAACLLNTLVDAALKTQRAIEAQPAGTGWEQDCACAADAVACIEIASLQAGCHPASALAQADACMLVLHTILERFSSVNTAA